LVNPLKARLKSTLVELAQRRGWELTPGWQVGARPLANHLAALFERYAVDCVLDVGANLGQYRDLIRDDVGFAGPIVSFEPVDTYATHLRQRAQADPRWSVQGYALGSADGSADINVTRSPGLNSFLAPRGDVVTDIWNDESIVATERVQIRALDEVIEGLRTQIGFSRPYLKLDTQGFDLEALRGAERSLASMCALQTEASIRPIYKGMPDYREVIEFTGAKGFDLSGMFPVTVDPQLRLVEFDCVMVNRRMADSLR
jgi:FkbM family methyltransferase